MDKITHEMRLMHWKTIVEQCQGRPRNQSAKQWLADREIPEKSYYYWQRKVRQEVYEKLNSPTAIPAVQPDANISFSEIPLSFRQESSTSFQPAAIVKTQKITVALSDSISERLLNQLLQAVHHA
ncbi:hypothetical protein M2454_000234 [Aequitasia blattaphilus]|uniref:IS66 family insertion sequence element accessory protein TnpB n=2 Tax=Lachnospiraceae TaxID=186803 RepID=A0ABT1EIU5_9FIRM|nr:MULTISPECIES: IS66 family insertion sequence element accessory protein TnpB [Lachnospiraceae]MCP1101013.1 IS66 family insertion sequence element accessory protein TnpB [Aequitasia blattaphilus]MCP1109606.1 IS66 family insertion sequence element accessory protein TnpB [Ohessyouella blattaphilus]MCR8563000.1 IS66 family insertion sequence element accessory protein TnpB [Ohessyouella blattaphilus]MCR8613653.1 IS66 family insertion sequence element accessory protein TnpB [Aequitasia blattaphilus